MADSRSYAWTGTPNASTSVERVNGVTARTNLFPNPGWEAGIGGVGGGAAFALASSTDQKHSGTKSLQLTRVAGQAVSDAYAFTNLPGMTSGLIYTISLWVFGGSGTYQIGVNGQAQRFAGMPAWQRVSMTFTAGDPVLYIAEPSGVTATSGSIYVDDVLVEAGSSVLPYFDGSFPSDLYGSASSTSTSSADVAGRPEFASETPRTSSSTLTHTEDREFFAIIERTFESDSAAWGSKPAYLSTDYDSVGPFWVGDSPLTAWAIEVDSETNLSGTFDSGEVQILNPSGTVVTTQPSPFLDDDTLIVTVPVGTFTERGIYRFVPRLIGRGSVTLPSVPVVIQADDGWQTVESARAAWSDAPADDERLYRLLDTARIQCEEFAPAFTGRAPENFRQAQLLQARSIWASGSVSQDDQLGGGQLTVTVFPMDWSVKNLLRPRRAVGAFF